MELSHLDSWGYHPSFAAAFARLARPELGPARILSDLGPRLEVIDATGVIRLAHASGRLRHGVARPTVGDWVAIGDAGAADEAVIHHVLPRRTQLVRRVAGRRVDAQVVAANVDTFFVVTSANRDANARRLERYLAAVWDSGAAPVVVVNKAELCEPGELAATLAELAAAAPGVPVIAVSAHTGAGVAALDAYLAPGATVALVGSSGVGKSSLVNRLLGHDHQRVLAIDDNARGRHATTRRQLFALPSGGLVLDTPGMRALGLVEGGGLDDAFAEVAELAAACRFRDCAHRGEPGCAVDAAIGRGALDPERRDRLHQLEREVAAIERLRDPVLAREQRGRWKAIQKSLRARAKVDPKLEP